jgi:hypothetical protein
LSNSRDERSKIHQLLANHSINDTLIKDNQTLIKYAETILFKTYGKEQILSEKPYLTTFKNGIWHMYGTLPEGKLGGTFNISIRAKNGKVIQLVHFN